VKFLVEEQGADVNVRDAWGYTPLHYAAVHGEQRPDRVPRLKAPTSPWRAGSGSRRSTWRGRAGWLLPADALPKTVELLQKLGSPFLCLETHFRDTGDWCAGAAYRRSRRSPCSRPARVAGARSRTSSRRRRRRRRTSRPLRQRHVRADPVDDAGFRTHVSEVPSREARDLRAFSHRTERSMHRPRSRAGLPWVRHARAGRYGPPSAARAQEPHDPPEKSAPAPAPDGPRQLRREPRRPAHGARRPHGRAHRDRRHPGRAGLDDGAGRERVSAVRSAGGVARLRADRGASALRRGRALRGRLALGQGHPPPARAARRVRQRHGHLRDLLRQLPRSSHRVSLRDQRVGVAPRPRRLGGGRPGRRRITGGDVSWDPVWEVQTSVADDRWFVEMRIPFSQLRFSAAEEQVWGLQMERKIRPVQEETIWSGRRARRRAASAGSVTSSASVASSRDGVSRRCRTSVDGQSTSRLRATRTSRSATHSARAPTTSGRPA
jgi:hypothetical protein